MSSPTSLPPVLPRTNVGYCTNVHPGKDLATYWQQLKEHAVGVKQQFSPALPMGIGLWFSANAADQLLTGGQLGSFRDWLNEVGLVPFTFNGFPYGDFHEAVVKHNVYVPTWMDDSRRDYTLKLAKLQNLLLPAGMAGSISTLPIAWGNTRLTNEQCSQAALHLRQTALQLRDLADSSGREIVVAIEPEPGCVFSFTRDLIRFYDWYLVRRLSPEDERAVRNHIRVCHDICHSAVMFEDQADVLKNYQAAGIKIGKFQVSAAVRMALDELPACGEERSLAIEQLRSFNEPKYLHQTMVRRGSEEPKFYEDLHLALAAESDSAFGEWRVHFHLPIFLERFGRLQSTQSEIEKCLAAAKTTTDCTHWEVETYAWGVLPPELKADKLASGLAREMQWLAERI